MEKKYKVIYLPSFYNDLDKITDYIMYKLENIIAANNLLDEIEKEIEKRSYNPDNYEKYVSTRRREDTYYRIYIKNYTIFYIVQDNSMELRRILYSKRNFKKLM